MFLFLDCPIKAESTDVVFSNPRPQSLTGPNSQDGLFPSISIVSDIDGRYLDISPMR